MLRYINLLIEFISYKKNQMLSSHTDNKIIIDHGTYYTKYGYSGYSKPFDKIKSKLYKNIETGAITTHKNDIDLAIFKPLIIIKNSVIIDFENITYLWDSIFESLAADTKNCSIMIIEPIFIPPNYHDTIQKIMLNKYNIKKVTFCNQQLLGLYGTCSDKGIIIDIGHSNTRIVPIFDSYILIEGIVLFSVCRESYNRYIFSLHKKEEKTNFQEMLFNPGMFGIMDTSLTDAVIKCIRLCPIDLRKRLCQNIVIIGGGSIGTNICNILKSFLEKNLEGITVTVTAPTNRHIISWLGGSIVSSISNSK